MLFEISTVDKARQELEIHNSNRYFNRVSKDKDELTLEEIQNEIREAAEAGAERFLIREGERYVGIIEFLMRNPSDGQTWLGLLEIHQAFHAQGFGKKALQHFYEIMRERGVSCFRIGVLMDNEPAHVFWKKQGFVPLEGTKMWDGKPVAVYEKKWM